MMQSKTALKKACSGKTQNPTKTTSGPSSKLRLQTRSSTALCRLREDYMDPQTSENTVDSSQKQDQADQPVLGNFLLDHIDADTSELEPEETTENASEEHHENSR
jgi:hypothetical protein